MRIFSPLHCALAGFCGILIFVGVSSCTSVDDTGRKQFNMLKPDQEAKLGFSEFEKLKKSQPISRDSKMNAQVQRVGSRLSRTMPVPNAEWEFVVFEDKSPNAFALPGGKVGVNTGLFQITQSDAGLAAVIGHEVGHVVARHSGERISQGVATTATTVVAAELLRQKAGIDPKITGAAVGGAGLLRMQSFSRKQELEADQLGALYMARSGYDPREAVELWKRFAAWRSQNGGSKVPAFLGTHPVDEVRIAELQEFMPRALSEFRG